MINKNYKKYAFALSLSILMFFPIFSFAKNNCEETMIGSYTIISYTNLPRIERFAIDFLSDDPMNGDPIFYLKKQNGRLVHIGARSGNVFGATLDRRVNDIEELRRFFGKDIFQCSYSIDGTDSKVVHVDFTNAHRSEVQELYMYTMYIWSPESREGDTISMDRAQTQLSLDEFMRIKYFYYRELNDGTIGLIVLIPLDKQPLP